MRLFGPKISIRNLRHFRDFDDFEDSVQRVSGMLTLIREFSGPTPRAIYGKNAKP